MDNKSVLKFARKIAFLVIIALGLLAAGVFASRSDMNYITINFSDDTSISVVTTKVKVADILEENNIVLLDNEMVEPGLDTNISASKTINITKSDTPKVIVAEEVSTVSTEEILGNYVVITEKIVTEQVEIPFETITKDVSKTGTETRDIVLQEGQNGLKEIKYKVKLQDEVEIERNVISETVIKEPVDKVIQISSKVTSRSGLRRGISALSLASTFEGVTPLKTTMNCSAYTASTCGKSPSNPSYGITASGVRASSWYTIAAGPSYPLGTVIYIPYFASQPNGGWFVVEDRGGAITNSRLDIYMDTVGECTNFGRRNLECYVYY